MDLLLGPGVSHPLTPINQHHPTQSQSSLLSNHSYTKLGSTLTIWSTWREEGRWATLGSTSGAWHTEPHRSPRESFPPPTFSPRPASLLEHATPLQRTEIHPDGAADTTLHETYLPTGDPKRSGEGRAPVHNWIVAPQALPFTSSLTRAKPEPDTLPRLAQKHFISPQMAQMESLARPKLNVLLVWLIRPWIHLILISALLSPPSPFLSLCITGGESKMVLLVFSLAPSNYSNVPPFSFLKKGTKKSAQISKANVIKQ